MDHENHYRKRILVVDDDPFMLELYDSAIREYCLDSDKSERENIDVTLCSQGEEALEAAITAVEEDEPYSVVFLDLNLPPGPDGLWTGQQIRKMDPHVNMVVVTAFVDTDLREISEKIPPADKLLYLRKPFFIQEIYQLSCALSAKWLSEREIRKANEMLNVELKETTRCLVNAIEDLKREVTQHKETGEELKLKKNQFKGIIDNMPEVAWLKDVDLRYILVNKAFCSLVNCSFEEIEGKRSSDLFPERYAVQLDEDEKNVLKGMKVSRSLIPHSKNGDQPKWYETIKTPLIDEEGAIIGVVGVARDITGHKNFQDALKEKHHSLRIEIDKSNSELKRTRRKLDEAKGALSVIGDHLEEVRQDAEMRIIHRVRTMIVPIIERLEKNQELVKYKADFDLLLEYITELTSDLASDIKIAASLSTTEFHVASMIKNGLTSEEIARQLYICGSTVKTHRKNIRKKLKLHNSGVNLRVFLEKKLGTALTRQRVLVEHGR